MSWYQRPSTNSRRTTTGAHYTGAASLKGVSFNSLTTGGVYKITDNSVVVAEATLGAAASTYISFGDEGTAITTDITFTLPAGTGSSIVYYAT